MQINDFSGLQYWKVTPTDIDGFVELSDKVYMFFELKYGDAEMPRGQDTALSRLCDALHEADRIAYLFLVKHDIYPPSFDVPVADQYIVKYRVAKKWRTPRARRR